MEGKKTQTESLQQMFKLSSLDSDACPTPTDEGTCSESCTCTVGHIRYHPLYPGTVVNVVIVHGARMAGAYTPAEYANMHFIYGECGGNANAAARLYRERYPNAERSPDYRVFINVHRSYAEGRIPGRVVPGHGGQGRPRGGHDDDVLEHVENEPGTSVRAIERTLRISKSTAHRILKRHDYHPYHYQRVQTLVPRDYACRVQFCETMLQLQRENPNFLNCVLWSDESTFHKDGFMNMHNLHSWSTVNPHVMREDRSQYRFKINLWTGILNGQIIGPFELPDTLTGEDYLVFLTTHLPGLLDDVPLATRRDMWLQNDGCPAHFAGAVRNYLDRTFEGGWIGRRGPVLWPARSPDLYPLDFFYWGYLKEKVYATPIANIQELWDRIHPAGIDVSDSGSARHITRSFIRRCRTCIRVEARHFEHLL